MAKIQVSPRFFLVFMLGLCAAACSSGDDRSQVLVDLHLGPGVPTPDRVDVIASQGGAEVKTFQVTWGNASSPNQVGLYFASNITGQVTIAAKAYAGNQTVAQGQIVEAVTLRKGERVGPFTLVLNAQSNPPGGDGGVQDSGVDQAVPDTNPTGAEVGDSAPTQPGLDAGPDAGMVDAAVDGGLADTRTPSDVPHTGDDAMDAPATDPHDTAPADATGEVGGGLAWQPAENVQKDPLNTCYSTVVAVDPVNEHVYVAWDEDASIKVARWDRRTATWAKSITLDDRGSPNSPAIGADAKGNVMVLWGQDTRGATPSLEGVWMSRTADGTNWSPPVKIASDASHEVTLALARNGTGHAAYSKKKGSYWPLHTAYYDGTAWTENPTAVEPDPYSADSEPQIAVSALGDGLMIYSKSWGVAGTVLTGTSYSAPIMLDPNHQSVSAYDPTIAVNRRGEGIVVWTEASGNNTVALARTYNPAVGWSSPTQPLVTASTVATPAVALDEQGMVTLVWQQNLDTGGANLMGKHGSLTGTWGETTILETDNRAGHSGLVTDYAYPKAAIDGSGNVLVVWRKDLTQGTSKTYGVYGTRYAAGTWLPQVKVGQKTGFDVPWLSLAVADSGLGAVAFKYIAASATTSDADSYSTMVALFR